MIRPQTYNRLFMLWLVKKLVDYFVHLMFMFDGIKLLSADCFALFVWVI